MPRSCAGDVSCMLPTIVVGSVFFLQRISALRPGTLASLILLLHGKIRDKTRVRC
jgi:hypothetical protein